MVDFRELVRLGAHFGHIKRRLHPKMNRYIWGLKNDVYLIDVSKTAPLIERAAKFLEGVASEGKTILWVGTKKPAQAAIFDAAQKLKMPYVNHRWIGGTLSNFSQVKKSVTKLLHYQDILDKSEKLPFYTKKEMNSIEKMVGRLKKNIGGIKDLTWPIGAIVLVDVIKEGSAMREAHTVGVPVVALVDTNSDPSLVDHVIPINDDSARVVSFVVDYLSEAAVRGQKNAKENAKKAKERAAAEAAEKKLKAKGTKPVIAKKAVAPAAKKEKKASLSAADKTKKPAQKAEAPDKKEAKPVPAKAAKPAIEKPKAAPEPVAEKDSLEPKKAAAPSVSPSTSSGRGAKASSSSAKATEDRSDTSEKKEGKKKSVAAKGSAEPKKEEKTAEKA